MRVLRQSVLAREKMICSFLHPRPVPIHRSLTYLHDAVSPGVVGRDVNIFEVVDDSDPVYAEPIWGVMRANTYDSW